MLLAPRANCETANSKDLADGSAALFCTTSEKIGFAVHLTIRTRE